MGRKELRKLQSHLKSLYTKGKVPKDSAILRLFALKIEVNISHFSIKLTLWVRMDE